MVLSLTPLYHPAWWGAIISFVFVEDSCKILPPWCALSSSFVLVLVPPPRQLSGSHGFEDEDDHEGGGTIRGRGRIALHCDHRGGIQRPAIFDFFDFSFQYRSDLYDPVPRSSGRGLLRMTFAAFPACGSEVRTPFDSIFGLPKDRESWRGELLAKNEIALLQLESVCERGGYCACLHARALGPC
jgi:hypothetical protein